MYQKIREFAFMVLFFSILFNSECFSYDNERVHQTINENAASQSTQLYKTLKDLGFAGDNAKDLMENNIIYGQNIKFWFREGARLEDETVCRSRNHFHDPLKSWGSAGLNNVAVNTYCLLLGLEKYSQGVNI